MNREDVVVSVLVIFTVIILIFAGGLFVYTLNSSLTKSSTVIHGQFNGLVNTGTGFFTGPTYIVKLNSTTMYCYGSRMSSTDIFNLNQLQVGQYIQMTTTCNNIKVIT